MIQCGKVRCNYRKCWAVQLNGHKTNPVRKVTARWILIIFWNGDNARIFCKSTRFKSAAPSWNYERERRSRKPSKQAKYHEQTLKTVDLAESEFVLDWLQNWISSSPILWRGLRAQRWPGIQCETNLSNHAIISKNRSCIFFVAVYLILI